MMTCPSPANSPVARPLSVVAEHTSDQTQLWKLSWAKKLWSAVLRSVNAAPL